MSYSLKQLAAPANLPLSLAELKLYLREEGDAQDDVITALLKSAVAHAERVTGRALMPQAWEFAIDTFPCNGIIRVPLTPLRGVSAIVYADSTGADQTVPPADYIVDSAREPGCVYPVRGKYWPYTCALPDAVRVQYSCGYSLAASPEDAAAERAAVPDDLKLALKMMVAHWYENRAAVEAGAGTQSAVLVPLTSDALLSPHRVYGVYP